MYKLTLALLLAVAAHPAAFGKRAERAAPLKSGRNVSKSAPRPADARAKPAGSVTNKSSVKHTRDAAAGRRAQRRAESEAAPGPGRASSRKAPPDSGATLPKKAGKSPKAAAGSAERLEAAPTRRAAPAGGTARGPKARAARAVTFSTGASIPVATVSAREALRNRDPNDSGNPLLFTSGRHRRKKVSKDFTAGQFAQSGGNEFTPARIDPQLVNCVQAIQDSVANPVKIESGYRPEWYNRKVYKKRGERPTSRSRHLSGMAADLRVKGMTGVQLAKTAIDACGHRVAIGLGPNNAHVDVRGRASFWPYRGTTGRQRAEVERHRKASREAARAARKGRYREAQRDAPSKGISQ